jgi:acylphosphatase
MIKHLTITITGKVQEVGFRFSALDEALELGLTGFVRNQGRNQVYIEVEGEVEKLKTYLRWCHTGPKGAKIDKVDYASSEDLKNFEGFAYEPKDEVE